MNSRSGSQRYPPFRADRVMYGWLGESGGRKDWEDIVGIIGGERKGLERAGGDADAVLMV